MENVQNTQFHAHYNPDTKQYQSNIIHNSETAAIALKKIPSHI